MSLIIRNIDRNIRKSLTALFWMTSSIYFVLYRYILQFFKQLMFLLFILHFDYFFFLFELIYFMLLFSYIARESACPFCSISLHFANEKDALASLTDWVLRLLVLMCWTLYTAVLFVWQIWGLAWPLANSLFWSSL